MRLLFLHGYRQNAAVFRARTGAVRKALDKGGVRRRENELAEEVECVYLDAPLLVQTSGVQTVNEGDAPAADARRVEERAWWFAHGEDGGSEFEYRHWDETLAYISKFCSENAPLHGVFGFSQGATVAALLLALGAQAREKATHGYVASRDDASGPDLLQPLAQLNFGVLVSGFPPRDPSLHQIVLKGASSRSPLSSATLHVVGEADAWVAPENSRALMAAWSAEAASLYLHDRGHQVPSNKRFTEKLGRFLAAQLPAETPPQTHNL